MKGWGKLSFIFKGFCYPNGPTVIIPTIKIFSKYECLVVWSFNHSFLPSFGPNWKQKNAPKFRPKN